MPPSIRKFKRGVSESVANLATKAPIESLIDSRTIDSDQLSDVAAARGMYWEYGSTETFEVQSPLSLEEHPQKIQEKVGCFGADQPFVAELENIDLVGPHPLARTSEGKYVLEQSLRSKPLFLRGLVSAYASNLHPSNRGQSNSREVYHTAVPMVGVWNRGFFHWFSEWLPRLEGVRFYIDKIDRQPTLLLPANPPSWMTSSLKLLGFDSTDWTEWSGGPVQIQRCVIPSLRRARGTTKGTTGYVVPPDAYRWVRNTIVGNLGDVEDEGHRRLLITRSGAAERRLTNTAELTRSIPGLEAIRLDGLDLEDQIRLFSNAELIIGPHGAGLTNLIYANNPVVIEGFGDFLNACYFTLSEGLQFTYGYLIGNPTGPDIEMDPQAVRALLTEAGFEV